jgi:hypothetical protein
MNRLIGMFSLAALLVGGVAVGDQMASRNQRQNVQAYEADQQRREIERQSQELEDLRAGTYDDRRYGLRPHEPDDNSNYDCGYDRDDDRD